MARKSDKTSGADALARLATEEEAFFKSRFLAPVTRGLPVQVRISGIVMSLTVQPRNFQGWGVFRPKNIKTAVFERAPTMMERFDYLKLFPTLRLILCRHDTEDNRDIWYGMPVHSSDARFKINGCVPVRLVEEVQLFDVVKCRYDGQTIWYEGQDERYDPRVPIALREDLAAEVTPGIQTIGDSFTPYEGKAYALAYADLVESRKDRQEERLKAAIDRAGGDYRSYVDRGDTYTIEFDVGGERHRSVVSKATLDVRSAGICLAGQDHVFDLQSLVSVIREGQSRRLIHHVGLGDDYDDE